MMSWDVVSCRNPAVLTKNWYYGKKPKQSKTYLKCTETCVSREQLLHKVVQVAPKKLYLNLGQSSIGTGNKYCLVVGQKQKELLGRRPKEEFLISKEY